MEKEIERKYLLLDESWKKDADEGIKLKQGYLNTNPDRTVRIRLVDKKGFITIKSKNIGIVRNEFEYEIPYDDTIELLRLCEQPLIEKIRHKVEIDNLIWEIDIFEGDNEGLKLAEVELRNENQQVIKPKWIGKEVSFENRYFNSNLVINPFKNWAED